MNFPNIGNRSPKKQVSNKRIASMEVVKTNDLQSLFAMKDIKKIKKFNVVDDSIVQLNYKNSTADYILASLLEFLCTLHENDKKASERKFKEICHFLIEKNMLNASSTLDEFHGLRANISKIFYNLLFYQKVPNPLTTYPQNIQKYERYKLEFDDTGQLGNGGFGSVRKAFNKLDGRYYAVKKICLKNKEKSLEISRIFEEVKTLASLKHKNIVGYNSAWLEYDDFQTPPSTNEGLDLEYSLNSDFTSNSRVIKEADSSSNSSDSSDCSNNQICSLSKHSICYPTYKTLYIQMELCQQTLEDWLNTRNSTDNPLIERIDVMTNLNILKGAVEGLEFIHSKGIIHRDIKPANIFLLDNFLVKIGDFGLAKRSYSSGSDTAEENLLLSVGVGTLTYSAPEQLHSSQYNTKSDIYSLGLIIYELYYSFTTMTERSVLFRKLKETSEVDDFVEHHFPDKAEIIKNMTRKDPAERLTAQNILSQCLTPTKDDIIRDQNKQIEDLKNQVNELKLLVRHYQERLPVEN